MSPRSSKQFEKIREDKITLIMDVALSHFAGNGYHATTIDHLAKHAGISKGLMYNYFSGKEELLSAIIDKSLTEVYAYFDTDRDGILSSGEFEFFIRKIFHILQGKKRFCQLLFQMFMQKEARSHLGKLFPALPGKGPAEAGSGIESESSRILRIITDYFVRKKDEKGRSADSPHELTLFLLTLLGFAVSYIYSDTEDESGFSKTVDVIIERYK